MTTDEVMAASVAIIRRHAGALCRRVLLFGSRARGGAHAGSDIDLGIAGNAPLPQPVLAAPNTVVNRDSAIKRFELTFELSWKALQYLLREQGFVCRSPRAGIFAFV